MLRRMANVLPIRNHLSTLKYKRISSGAKLSESLKEKESSCNTICFNDVYKAVENHTLIIDVRSNQDVAETGLIPTSINIPMSCLQSKMELSKVGFRDECSHLKPKKRDLIIVTGKRGRSNSKAVDILRDLGYTRTVDYPGGYEEFHRRAKELAAAKKSQCGQSNPCGEKTTKPSCEKCDLDNANCDDT